MTLLSRVAAIALGAGAMIAVVSASMASITVHGSNEAVLRLAWSARPERIEQCRQQSEEELARLPPHMRQPVVCEGVAAAYRLTVRREGALVAQRVVRGGGLRHDRRLYVFHEVVMPSGEGAIDIRFDRLDAVTPSRLAGASVTSLSAVPPHLSFEQRVRFRPREAVLITYDPDRRTLVARQGSALTGTR
jgi:hypothetical protein